MKKAVQHIITPPLTEESCMRLMAGDSVLIRGSIYTARDAAHQRMVQCLERGEPLPVSLDGQIIYYAGPSPAKPGHIVGSIGPTTAGRMDAYAPALIEAGLKGMIGKGSRSGTVTDAMRKHHAVYLGAIGGAAVLLAKCILEVQIEAYEDLGPEAVRRLVVHDFPAVVINDCHGNDLYRSGRKNHLRSIRHA
ncbi:Fe-S-containing hydro-lyase [bacterium]|nr:Fe-S-containing hydro-lyase [bacterium]